MTKKTGRPRVPLAQRFWTHVTKSDTCWNWGGSRTSQGYGTTRDDNRRNIAAHRAAWQLANGRNVPEGLGVLHRCDNKRCVNPDHLWVGTQQDNIDDKMRKMREARGSRVGTAKLTEQHVRELRFMWQTNRFSLQELAAKYAVSRDSVERAIHGHTFSHVSGAVAALPHSECVKRAGEAWRRYAPEQ